MKKVWCVRFRDGWCACKKDEQFDEAADNIPTMCNHYVILPWGAKRRLPTCKPCLERLDAQEKE